MPKVAGIGAIVDNFMSVGGQHMRTLLYFPAHSQPPGLYWMSLEIVRPPGQIVWTREGEKHVLELLYKVGEAKGSARGPSLSLSLSDTHTHTHTHTHTRGAFPSPFQPRPLPSDEGTT